MKPSFAFRTALGALAVSSFVFAVAPASAKLGDPDAGNLIAGGYFRGLPLGPKSASAGQDRVESTEVAGEACYLVPSRVADERGRVKTRLVRMCE